MTLRALVSWRVFWIQTTMEAITILDSNFRFLLSDCRSFTFLCRHFVHEEGQNKINVQKNAQCSHSDKLCRLTKEKERMKQLKTIKKRKCLKKSIRLWAWKFQTRSHFPRNTMRDSKNNIQVWNGLKCY